jgi:hypothetical protein
MFLTGWLAGGKDFDTPFSRFFLCPKSTFAIAQAQWLEKSATKVPNIGTLVAPSYQPTGQNAFPVIFTLAQV